MLSINYYLFDKPSLRRLTAFLCLLIMTLIFCARQTVFNRIENGDVSMVRQGRYDKPAVFLDEGGIFRKQVLEIRTIIEKHFDLMPIITEKYYQLEQDPVFTFKYAMHDTIDNLFVLRYFARTYDNPLLAGYEIFFCFHRDDKRVTKIYTNEVPLE